MSAVQRMYESYDWNRPFDFDQCRESPEAVRLLYENWLMAAKELEKTQDEIAHLAQRLKNVDRENAVLRSGRQSLLKRRWISFGLQLVATPSLALGIGMVNAPAGAGAPGGVLHGWPLVVVALVLQVVAFVSTWSEGK
jgi:hypothetical protein